MNAAIFINCIIYSALDPCYILAILRDDSPAKAVTAKREKNIEILSAPTLHTIPKINTQATTILINHFWPSSV